MQCEKLFNLIHALVDHTGLKSSFLFLQKLQKLVFPTFQLQGGMIFTASTTYCSIVLRTVLLFGQLFHFNGASRAAVNA